MEQGPGLLGVPRTSTRVGGFRSSASPSSASPVLVAEQAGTYLLPVSTTACPALWTSLMSPPCPSDSFHSPFLMWGN